MSHRRMDPVEAAKNIQLYFDKDGRYATECFVSNGALGHVYKLKTTSEGETRRLIVKIPFEAVQDVPARARRNFMTEEASLKICNRWWQALQAAMHVVNRFEIPDDPLHNPVPQGAVSIVKGWVYMERLENGTLEQFITRAKGRSAPLPNRLIWRLLMCFIRMHIALSWPTSYAAGNIKLETIEGDYPSYILYNSDIHSQNVMFGHFSSDDLLEHEITPILKMIDLGGVEKRATPTVYAWNAAIQKLLAFLPQVSSQLPYRLGSRAMSYSLTDMHLFPKELEPLLFAGRDPDMTLKYDPRLDLDLYRVIDPSMGSVNLDPMSLHYMEQVATEAIRTRTAEWYRNNMPRSNLDETDEAAIRLVRELILEPSNPNKSVADAMQALIEGFDSLAI
ncbi:kinase-like domain-containing protein [Apiospora marii]|uniref:kinase-like domain-containing protein n=1 Tax=Apiospora marii TaxID=335849 RepID=UPI0031302435